MAHDPVADIAIVSASFLLPFLAAVFVLWPWVFGGSIGSGGGVARSQGRFLVRLAFSAVFALCMNMLLLALYEIVGEWTRAGTGGGGADAAGTIRVTHADVLEPPTRLLTWRMVLVSLTLLLVSAP